MSVDDASVPVDALAAPRMVNPGKHVVLVTLDGSQRKKSAFELAEGQTRVVTVDLTPDAAAGSSTVAPPASSSTGGAPSPGATDAGVKSSGPSAMTWIGFGVGGVGLLVGGVTGIIALGKDATVKDNCPNQGCPPAYHDDLDAAKRFSTISTVSFGIGLVGIGVGVWGLLSTPSNPTASRPPAAASVQPWVGVGTVGVTGAF